MLEQLTERFSRIFGGMGRLTEKNIEQGLKEVRLALLEADVNYKVVKDFVARIGEAALGEKVLKSITPTQQFIKVVYDELVDLMGGEGNSVSFRKGQCNILLSGLQGSGKTTTAAKLAARYKKDYRFLLVSADVYRPAAMEQLKILADEVGVAFFEQAFKLKSPQDIAKKAARYAAENGYNGIILDTAGRLEIDQEMMRELVQLSKAIKFDETYFVADATAGQTIADTVAVFHDMLDLSGLILTKLDSDTRGGAALSVKAVTGKPIAFIGTGEKVEDLELFHPERIASRILGKGDILTLIENTQQVIEEDEAERLEKRIRKNEFNLEDFRDQIRKLRKMGPLSKIAELLPGGGMLGKQQMDEKQLIRIEAIINSMTPFERKNTNVLGAGRRKRIARGSGTNLLEVNKMLNKFQDMKKMMKKISKNPQLFDKFQQQGMPDLNVPFQ